MYWNIGRNLSCIWHWCCAWSLFSSLLLYKLAKYWFASPHSVLLLLLFLLLCVSFLPNNPPPHPSACVFFFVFSTRDQYPFYYMKKKNKIKKQLFLFFHPIPSQSPLAYICATTFPVCVCVCLRYRGCIASSPCILLRERKEKSGLNRKTLLCEMRGRFDGQVFLILYERRRQQVKLCAKKKLNRRNHYLNSFLYNIRE